MDPDHVEPSIMLTHSTRPWAHAVHRYVVDHGGATVRGYAVSPESATDAPYDVLVLDDITSFISPLLVTRLHDQGTLVIGVYDPADGGDAGAKLLEAYGVDAVVPADTPIVDLVAKVASLAPRSHSLDPDHGVSFEPSPTQRYPLIAAVGAAGGCGATEVAIAFTSSLSRYLPVVLIDGDTQRPSLAQRLHLDVHPNLLTAIDRTLHNEPPTAAFASHDGLDAAVIVGIPDPSQWGAIRPGELAELLAVLRRDRAAVVNIACDLEELPGAGSQRFGITRSIVSQADAIVLVATADPVGVRRTVDWLAASRELRRDAPVHLLLNRCPFGSAPRASLEVEVGRNHAFASVRSAGVDRRLVAAGWSGATVGRGSLARSMRRMAGDVVEEYGL